MFDVFSPDFAHAHGLRACFRFAGGGVALNNRGCGHSCGVLVGPDINTMDLMNFDEQNAVSDIKLFTGDKHMTLPIGGFNNEGRVIIVTDEPYPFNLLAVVREVSFGG